MKSLTYEFVVPSSVFLFDEALWPDLPVVLNGMLWRIQRPTSGTKHVRVDGTLGNEGVIIEYSIIRLLVDVPEHQDAPEWYVPFHLAKECLTWIRVAGRQYWLTVLMGPSDSLARGSIISQVQGQLSYTNFGASKMPIPPQPLQDDLWRWIGIQLTRGNKPPIPDIMFCDALLKLRDSDYLQTVIQLGITCEVELNAFIDDLLAVSTEQIRVLYKASRPTFSWKLRNMPALLGVEPYQTAMNGLQSSYVIFISFADQPYTV